MKVATELPDGILGWLGGLIGGVISFMVTWVWKVRGTIAEAERNIADIENEMRDKLSATERGLQQVIDSSMRVLQRDTDEIKDLLHKHEMYVRDTFARRESFYQTTGEIKASIEKGLEKLERQIREDRADRHGTIDALREDINALQRTVAAFSEQR